MSHEGIRIVSAEQAQREAAQEERLPAEAIAPAKVKVHLTEGTGVEITWKDGHHSSWSFPFLREACPCATCHEERERNGRLPGEPRPKPPSLLPMYEAPSRPTEASPVGRYAIKFKWNDGHEAGIYSWEFLRRVCSCAPCQAKLRAGRDL